MNLKRKFKGGKGITLIALVVTIIVILLLARSKHNNANRSKWNIKQSIRIKRANSNICQKRRSANGNIRNTYRKSAEIHQK